MKYTEAWANVTSQNIAFKFFSIVLALACILLAMICLTLSFRDPLMIERGCSSKVLQPSTSEHNRTEIENFLKEALTQRFDTSSNPSDGLISPDELRFRLLEQKDFQSRGITQRVIFNSFKEDKDSFLVDADRLISVGQIRSAFRFSIVVKLESKARSLSNPFGLLLVSTKPTEKQDESKR